MRDSVSVNAQGSSYREDVNGLHRLYGKAVGVGEVLNLTPSCPTLRVHDFVLGLDGDFIEAAHVEDEATFSEGLSSHAVALSCHRYFEVVVAGKDESAGNVVNCLDSYNSKNGRLVQAACVIDEPVVHLEG